MRALALAILVSCTRAPTVTPTPNGDAEATATVSATAPATATASASASDAAVSPPVHPERAFALPTTSECHDELRCLIERAYPSDEKARTLALALFDETGDVAGTDRDFTMDGGFRGALHITPALPTGDARVQLERVVTAARDYESFFKTAYSGAPPSTYRWRDLTFRFFRSSSGPRNHEVERTTPSAYAIGPRPTPQGPADDISFSLAYNVKGSLLGTDTGVRETVFHEVFHMNDAAHGDWSPRALRADYDAIVKKCGAMNVACLAPYAPNDTMVRGGTYYAFEPNNGLSVREYAAELALRWYKEHRALQRHEQLPTGKPFKCGPPENRRAWDAIVKEFFSLDLVPPCP
jgi:hypothetical protein